MEPFAPGTPAGGDPSRSWLVGTLVTLLDSFGVPAALYDDRPALLHHNAELGELAGDPDRDEALWRVLDRTAEAALGAAPPTGWEEPEEVPEGYRLAAVVLPTAEAESRLVAVRLTPLASIPSRLPRRKAMLTPRELQVVRLLAWGRRDAEIATALGISRHTARRHVERILRKLQVGSRAQAVAHLARGPRGRREGKGPRRAPGKEA